jgi:hypothetical protein
MDATVGKLGKPDLLDHPDHDLWWDSHSAEQDWADRWSDAWDKLEPLGIVNHPEDSQLPLAELERLAAMLPNQ